MYIKFHKNVQENVLQLPEAARQMTCHAARSYTANKCNIFCLVYSNGYGFPCRH